MTTPHDDTDTDTVPEKYRPDPWIDATVGTRESTTKLSIATPTIPTRDWAGLDEDDHVGFAPISDTEVVFGESVPRILGEKTVREHSGNDRKTYLPRAVIDYLNLEPPARIRYHKPDPSEDFPRVRVELVECGPGTEVPDYTACSKTTTHDRPSTYRWDDADDRDTTDDTPKTMLRRPRPDRQHSSPLDPSDLLDDDGRVDHNKIRSRANRPSADARHITDELCHRIRVMLTDGLKRYEVADELDISESSVSFHANGECLCTAEAAPREWTNGVGWHVRGESPRDDETETHPDQTALADGGTDATK